MDNKIIDEIKTKILEEIIPEKIFVYNTGPIYLFIIIWESEMDSLQKHTHIRKLLRSVNSTFDIIVYSKEEFDQAILKNEYPSIDIIQMGKLLYEDIH